MRADAITIKFGGLTAVNGTSTFTIPEQAIVSLIGPNGAGKTTFFNVLTGLYRPTTGRVYLGDARRHRASRRTGSPTSGSPGRSRTSGCSTS